jgi:hypothetical protein
VDSKFGSAWVGGVLLIHLGRIGWGLGRIFGWVGGYFLVIPDLQWEMAPSSDSGMICGVEMAFKEAFLVLYSIAFVNDAYVAIHLDLSSGSL